MKAEVCLSFITLHKECLSGFIKMLSFKKVNNESCGVTTSQNKIAEAA